MSFLSSLSAIPYLLAAMACLALLEAAIPLRKRTAWSVRHLGPNLALTFLTFATNLLMNIPMLLALLWFQSSGWGVFNALEVNPVVAFVGGVLAFDLAWYATHVSMHKIPFLWRLHLVHHSDPIVDVTTAIRQHPGESLLRYVFLAAFGAALGAPPAAFAVYRLWSAFHGFFEHANIKLAQGLDEAIAFVFTSPNMHKVHHSREARYTDRNFSNIFSIWDRLFGTFTPTRHGQLVDYGLDGYDAQDQQTTLGLLAAPFAGPRRGFDQGAAAGMSSPHLDHRPL